ncbi:MAG: type IV pilin protein [Pseudomonadota bacterium]|nr:type IV pilin protein [Pseudomonadota bacterium]
MRQAKGVTLIEVMIALAILMILTTLAYPGYASYIIRTRRLEGMVALVETMQQQERYFMRNNRYLDFSAAAPDPDAPQFHAWSGASAARSAYELDGRACPGQALADCIELHASPGTAQVGTNFKDPDCGVLMLDSTGRRTASGTASNCWP